MNLLSEAAKLAYRPEFGGQLPTYQVAGFSPAQQAALQAGMQQGVGSFLPYIESGNVALGGGYGAAGQGIGALGTAQIAGAGAAGAYDPRSAAAFMNPYQQAVTEQSLLRYSSSGRHCRPVSSGTGRAYRCFWWHP
jgi:hypothetical protein